MGSLSTDRTRGENVNTIAIRDRSNRSRWAENAKIVSESVLLKTTTVKQRDVVYAFNQIGLMSACDGRVGWVSIARDWVEGIGANGCGENTTRAGAIDKHFLVAKYYSKGLLHCNHN